MCQQYQEPTLLAFELLDCSDAFVDTLNKESKVGSLHLNELEKSIIEEEEIPLSSKRLEEEEIPLIDRRLVLRKVPKNVLKRTSLN